MQHAVYVYVYVYVKGVYATHCRVIPNLERVFQITFLNINTSPIDLHSLKYVGNLIPVHVDDIEVQPVCNNHTGLSHAWNSEINNKIDQMLQNEIIRPSSSPWNAPVILVKKKDGSIRFVCDFGGLNDVTKKDSYPLQERIQTIATVARAIVKISVFDFRNSHLKTAV